MRKTNPAMTRPALIAFVCSYFLWDFVATIRTSIASHGGWPLTKAEWAMIAMAVVFVALLVYNVYILVKLWKEEKAMTEEEKEARAEEERKAKEEKLLARNKVLSAGIGKRASLVTRDDDDEEDEEEDDMHFTDGEVPEDAVHAEKGVPDDLEENEPADMTESVPEEKEG